MDEQVEYISHWAHLFENLQASSLEFYASLEQAVGSRLVPEIHSARVQHKEGGLASANRQYLRMHRGKYAFDICGAPFGTGFFVSWWLTKPPLRFGFLYTLLFLAGVGFAIDVVGGVAFGIGAAMSGITFGAFLAVCFAGLGVPALLWLLGNALRQGVIRGESTVLAMPLVGWLYQRVFAPTTYYSVDTALMFQDAVHNAVLEVTDGMTANKGVRALTETERKPIMKKFAATV